MTRRKREIIGLRNERDFPYLVELALPPGGFRSVFLEIDAFHRERRIPVRRGRSRHEVKPFYIRFCFPDTATADAFRKRFGGECLTHAPEKPKGSRRSLVAFLAAVASPKRSVTPFPAGRPSVISWTMVVSSSITIRSNARSDPSPWGARTICSPAPTVALSDGPPFVPLSPLQSSTTWSLSPTSRTSSYEPA